MKTQFLVDVSAGKNEDDTYHVNMIVRTDHLGLAVMFQNKLKEWVDEFLESQPGIQVDYRRDGESREI